MTARETITIDPTKLAGITLEKGAHDSPDHRPVRRAA
jgi:hypothetical protein